jgi:hypothetical protein
VSPKHTIARLLAGKNELSRVEKDAILSEVLAQTAPARSSRRWAAGLALAAAATALLLLPWVLRSDPSGEASFTGRGASPPIAAFSLGCRQACQNGDTLVFDLEPSSGYRYFSAFARHTDGTVIWYFPEAESAESLDLVARSQKGLLDKGVALGNEHRAGRYAVYGIFSNVPLTRTDIRERFVEGASELVTGQPVAKREIMVR